MTDYNKNVPFPEPYLPGAFGGALKDPFANLTKTGGHGLSQPGGGGGGGGSSLPAGAIGDMLTHDGTDWVTLLNPGTPTGTNPDWVLRHHGVLPYWETPQKCV